MPFLRDEGPPVSQATIQKLRGSLPVEYGWQVVNEGREVLAVRVDKPKPDYLHDLSEVAFYVSEDVIKNTKDVLLIGHEKTARLEPRQLRDHIRAQAREDVGVVEQMRRTLDRAFGHTFLVSPQNHEHQAFAVRIPKDSVAEFTPEDVRAIREIVSNLRARLGACQYAYLVANRDHERLGRRVLLELVGLNAPEPLAPESAPSSWATSGAVAPSAPAAAPIPAPPAAAPQPSVAAIRSMFPPTPGTSAAKRGADATADASSVPAPTPAAVIAATPPAPPPAAVAPIAPPAAVVAPPPSSVDVAEHEEYTIVSKPKAAAPPPAPVAPMAPAPGADHDTHGLRSVLSASGAAEVHEEYEIVIKPKAAVAPVEAPVVDHAPDPSKKVLREDKEYEVFTSAPKPREKATITPPGMGGFMNAIQPAQQHAPARTKEYEIQSGRSTVPSEPSIVSRMRLPSAAPPPAASNALTGIMAAAGRPMPKPEPSASAAPPPPAPAAALPAPGPATLPRVPTPAAPADSGAVLVATVAPAAPELILAQRFREAGYEVVEGLKAQGTQFAFAAHKPHGRRVLVKRSTEFGTEEAASLASLVAALGADVALVVADRTTAGTRLATWGTRIEIVTPGEVPGLTF